MSSSVVSLLRGQVKSAHEVLENTMADVTAERHKGYPF